MLSARVELCERIDLANGRDREQDSEMSSDVEPGATRPCERIFAIFGGSGRSLSPQIHNAAYRAYGLSASYESIIAREGVPLDLVEFLTGTFDERLGGLTVVSPYKERAIEVATEVTPIARRSGAAN